MRNFLKKFGLDTTSSVESGINRSPIKGNENHVPFNVSSFARSSRFGHFFWEKIDTRQVAAESDVNEQSLSTNAQSGTKEDVLTTAKNQDNFEGGLHTGLDQSGTGLEVDFQAEKIDSDQVTVKPDVNEEVVSTNTQSVTKEDVQTTAENQDKLGGGLHTGLNQSGRGLEGDFSGKKIDTSQSGAESDANEQFVYWDDLIRQIDAQMERIGWSVERGRQDLLNKYGIRSRLLLSDEQVFEFLAFLKTQPTRQPGWEVGQECLYNGVKVLVERLLNRIVAVVRRYGTGEEIEVALAHLKPVSN